MVAVFDPGVEFPKPSMKLLFGEVVSLGTALSNAPQFFGRVTQPETDKNTEFVYIAPGTAAGGFTLIPLAKRLAKSGINVTKWDWNRFNLGPTNWAIPREVKAIRNLVEQAGGPITYIGHSLGGLYGFFLARSVPGGLIKHAIALGSPGELGVEGASTSTNVGPAIKFMQAAKPVYQERLINHWRPERELVPLVGVQRSSIIAVKDGVVNSLACELPDQPGCKNFYVFATHLDFLTDETVAKLVAFLTVNGNQVELPPELQAKLATREDIFKYKDELVELPDDAEIIPLVDPTNPVDDLISEPNGVELIGRFLGSVTRPLCDLAPSSVFGNRQTRPSSPSIKAAGTSSIDVLGR